MEFDTRGSTVCADGTHLEAGTARVAERTKYAVELVAPYRYQGLDVFVDADDLVIGNGDLEERVGLRDLKVRERDGDNVRITADDGRELTIRTLDIHPLDLVEFILDARAARRGLDVRVRTALRPWPELADAPNSADGADEPDPGSASGEDGSTAGASQPRRPKRWFRSILLICVLALVALGLGGVVGDVVNEASGPGVGDAIEIKGPFVVRNVTGVGADELSPFTAEGPWELEWENLSPDGGAITIVAISNVNREDRVLVSASTDPTGTVGPLPSGSYRLAIESDSSWHVVVSVSR